MRNMAKTPKAPKPRTDSKRILSSKADTSPADVPSKWIRTDRPFPLPHYVRAAIEHLDGAGHLAYVVGGSVRDFLLQGLASELPPGAVPTKPKDHDIATSADPDELCRLFPSAITVGKAFGVLKIPIESSDPALKPVILEIATFREDLEYEDHRHPTSVRFSGPLQDARRRDFTINALFFDPKTSRILDSVGGLDDLRAGVLRAIGEPSARFKEDALRLLRAIRFATRLGFQLEPQTRDAIRERARLIQKVSSERIREELTWMLTGPRPREAIQMCVELGILGFVLPEVATLRQVAGGAAFRHTLKILDALVRQNPAGRSPELAWGALLHAVGKPVAWGRSGEKNFNGHEIEGARIAQAICERMKFSRAESDAISSLVEEQVKFREVFQMREATLQRFIRQPLFATWLAFHRADALALDGNQAFHEFCASRLRDFRSNSKAGEEKLVKGEDLIQLGLKPGPKFSEIIRTLEDLAFEGKLRTKEEALEYVVKYFVS